MLRARHIQPAPSATIKDVLSRRSFLLGGAATVGIAVTGFVAVENDWLPGRVAVGTALGRCDLPLTLPTATPGPLANASFDSTYRQRTVNWTLALPPGPQRRNLPVALVLHGRGDNARSAFDQLQLHRYLAAYVDAGGRPFALASVDGGQEYWHPRASGDDPLGMIVNELLPRLRGAGFRPDGIGVLGWSMGGYGALLLARQSAAGQLEGPRIAAAAAASPALFGSFAETSPGAFDDAKDFAAWGDLVAHPGVDRATALLVSCGDTDAFTAPATAYRASVQPLPAGAVNQGCHDATYWHSQATEQIAFLGQHLAGGEV